ncbi:hypothetical protein [Streptomyces malaysiensis]|uniref:Uncharacterized protein n=1 Tax=Streptomyces malaysiensis subsp. samsunensis TaxID=459658 RepID=A0A9X2RT56_STRMQ|nr:hypothetical protein [Streptomyces samsunensis]MCQ8829887.1 hypothetical protein [Streptomyces samsunensis]
MDAAIAAVVAAAVGALAALVGARIGGRSAVEAAAVAGAESHELSRAEARCAAYADLGTAAFQFSRTFVNAQTVINGRHFGISPEWQQVDPALYSTLDSRQDDVAHAAMIVQLHGPMEIVDLAWDIYAQCQRAERRLAEYAVALRPGAEEARRRAEEAWNAVSRARGIFLSNGRAHLEGQPIPLEGEPYLHTLDRSSLDRES